MVIASDINGSFRIKQLDCISRLSVGGDSTKFECRSTTSTEKEPEGAERTNKTFHHVGHLIIILGGIAMGNMLLMRLTIAVSIMSMVNHTQIYLHEDPDRDINDLFEPGYVEVGEFNWNNEIQQLLISGYMVAYTLPQISCTRLAKKYGIRISVPICLSICAFSCLLTPIMAYWGWGCLLFLRCLNGLGAAALLPTMIGAIEIWIPLKHSASGLALLQFVQSTLIITAPLISGELTSIHWKWSFYVPGLAGLLFSLIWWLIARDNPESCSFISERELDKIKGIEYIDTPLKLKLKLQQQQLAKIQEAKKKTINDEVVKKPPAINEPKSQDLPWYFMFKIKSFYGFITIWLLYCSTGGAIIALLPAYFNRVLKISVENNGFYNFVIQIGSLFSMLWPNLAINFLRNSFNLSLTVARRMLVVLCMFLSVATWAYVAAYHENQILFFCLNRFFHVTNDTIVIATLMTQFGQEGLSSEVFSMMNTIGNIGSVVFCWAAGRFLDSTGESIECWSWIFITFCIMNTILTLIYVFCMKSEPISVKCQKDKQIC